ncbi:MAG: choice-of-anchor D domain-containing protein [Betaproteobacteria bacterium]
MTFKRFVAAAAVLAAAMAGTAHAQFVVTNTNDSGAGSLRQAMLDANASCISVPSNPAISFNIAGTGPFAIRPLSPLPSIACAATTIDGYTQPGSAPNTSSSGGTNARILVDVDGSQCAVRTLPCTGAGIEVLADGATISGLAVHSFGGPGIRFTSPSTFGTINIAGNFVGTDPGGVTTLGNTGAGIDIVQGSASVGAIGQPGLINLITGNKGPGINLQAGAFFSSILGNLIGGRRDGFLSVSNSGAGIASSSSSTISISGNYIRFNGGPGILVTGSGSHNILGNPSIFGNGGAGIVYSAGSPYPAPNITSLVYDSVANQTTITAQMTGAPPTGLPGSGIDLYSNALMPGVGEGRTFLGNAPINIDAAGNGTTRLTVPGQAKFVTGTFTFCGDGCFGTSVFSLPDSPPTLSITFTPNPLATGSAGSIAMVLQNPNKTRQLGLVGFTFGLPTGLQIGAESAGADCAAGVSFAGATSTVASVGNITLAPGTTCTVTAPLTASAAGTFTLPAGSITVNSDAGPGTNNAATLTVTAAAGIAVNPSSIDFGAVPPGSSSSLSVTVQSTGSAPLSVSGATVTGAGFTLGGNTCTGSIAAPGTCTITIIFAPNAAAAFSGQLSITSNASPSPLNVALAGTGGAPGLQFSPASLTFAPQSVGTTSPPQGATLTNAGSTSVDVSSISVTGDFAFTGCAFPLTLAPGASCTLSITSSPQSAGTLGGAISVASTAAGSPTTLPLSGSGVNGPVPGIVVSPTSLDFAGVQPGSSRALTVTVQSTGTAPLSVAGASVTGTGFTLSGNTCTTSIAAPGTCALTVTFAPGALGAFAGQLAITSNASPSPLNVPLTGNGGGPAVQFSPPSVAFPRQNVGTTSAPQAVTLTNTGTAALDITSIAIAGDFGYAGCGFPLTLPPGASCTFSITFSPQGNGILAGSISVVSNAAGSPSVLPLSGTGVNGPTAGISLLPSSVGFGVIRVGTSATGQFTIFSNGSAPLDISGIAASGAFFSQSNSCPATLPVGSACVVTVTYAPGSLGDHRGQVAVSSNGDPATATVILSGSAVDSLPALLSVEGEVDFGQRIVGTSTRHSVALHNAGEQTLDIASLAVTGTGFRLEGACGSIAPGGTCTVDVVFEPSTLGIFAGSLEIVSNDARGTLSVSLLGESLAAARPEIDLTPDGIGFANQMITTQSVVNTVTVASTGTAALHILGITVTGPFVITASTCGDALDPGAHCQVSVGFLPFGAGFAEGRLTVASDAQAGRSFVSLTGTGCRYYSIAGMRNLLRLCAP